MPGEPVACAYFDTSVLVKCYVMEQGTQDALSLTGRHAVLSSAIAPTGPSWSLDLQVLTRAESVVGMAPVRTLDALHLASVLVFQAETHLRPPFVTGDAQQRRAADALVLDVVFVG